MNERVLSQHAVFRLRPFIVVVANIFPRVHVVVLGGWHLEKVSSHHDVYIYLAQNMGKTMYTRLVVGNTCNTWLHGFA